ncbi:hypothetical protein H4R21_001328 [Coemansia helicoidea]|uniref:Uncharacterized protein n=1 Tax=Coemansia helicoidea TaxID=1286919 RepID=A0ACC1LBE0_9FUNG|nr:hypothetical protein H4R21_001328 [Coemansia helicoidea]
MAPSPPHVPMHGRVDKRKRRRPTRSLSLAGPPAASNTVRMTYADDYRRDPGAYSRALMGAPHRPPPDRYSAPPACSSSSASPQPSVEAASVQETPAAAVPATPPPAPQRPQRKDVPGVIRRLFPSLDSADAIMHAAAKLPPRPPARAVPQPESRPPLHAPSPPSSPPPPSAADAYGTDDLAREIALLRPHVATCTVKWTKAAPMDIAGFPGADDLAPAERECCSILRLYPEQYLTIKHALVRASRTMPANTFKKRDAQRLCRVDVNKTSKVYEWFCKLGWIPHVAARTYTAAAEHGGA